MNTYSNKKQESTTQSVANSKNKAQSNNTNTYYLQDNREQSVAQRQVLQLFDKHHENSNKKVIQGMFSRFALRRGASLSYRSLSSISTNAGGATNVSDTTQEPSSTELATIPEPASTELATVPEPASTELATVPEPASTALATIPEPDSTALATIPEPSSTALATIPEQSSTALATIPEPSSTALATIPEPSSTALATIPEQSSTIPSSNPSQQSTTELAQDSTQSISTGVSRLDWLSTALSTSTDILSEAFLGASGADETPYDRDHEAFIRAHQFATEQGFDDEARARTVARALGQPVPGEDDQ